MTEVGSAYVRIRPNFTGFQTETQTGVASAFGGIGKTLAATFAGVELFKIGKEAITGAADLQKQVEAINAEFGTAAQSVVAFGERSAAGFNITTRAADSAAAKLGLFLQAVNVAPDAAAQMTIQLEKTAGALGQIKNIDPSQILQLFNSGLRGQGRGLAQYGIVLDQTQVKLEAVKLGLISTTKDALTPGQKAIASFEIITSHLPQYLQDAKAHSGDFATAFTHLKVQLTDFADKLGTRLLPFLTRLVAAASLALPKAFKLASTAFDAIRKAFTQILAPLGGFTGVVHGIESGLGTLFGWVQKIIGPLGGLKTIVEALLAVFAVNKILTFVGALKNDLGIGAFGSVEKGAQQAATGVDRSVGQIQASSQSAVGALDNVGAAVNSSLSGIDARIAAISGTFDKLATGTTASVERTVAAVRSASGATVVALDSVASGFGTVLDGLQAQITRISDELLGLAAKAKLAGAGLTGVSAKGVVAPAAVSTAARVAATVEAAAPVAAITSGFAAQEVTQAGGDLAKVMSEVAAQSKETARAIDAGFAGSSIEDYAGHLKEVVDKVGEVKDKFKEVPGAAKSALAETTAAAQGTVTSVQQTADQVSGSIKGATGEAAAGLNTVKDSAARIGAAAQEGATAATSALSTITSAAHDVGLGVAGGMGTAVEGLTDVNAASANTAASFDPIKASAIAAARGVEGASGDMVRSLGAASGAASVTATSFNKAGTKIVSDLRGVTATSDALRADLAKPLPVPVVPPVLPSVAALKEPVPQFGATPHDLAPMTGKFAGPEWQAAHERYLASFKKNMPQPAEIAAGKAYRAELEKLVAQREAETDLLKKAALKEQAVGTARRFSGPFQFGLPSDFPKISEEETGKSVAALGSVADEAKLIGKAAQEGARQAVASLDALTAAGGETAARLNADSSGIIGGLRRVGVQIETTAAQIAATATARIAPLVQRVTPTRAVGGAALAGESSAISGIAANAEQQVTVVSGRLKKMFSELVHGFNTVGADGVKAMEGISGAAGVADKSLQGLAATGEAAGAGVAAGAVEASASYRALVATIDTVKLAGEEASASLVAGLDGVKAAAVGFFTTVKEFSKQVFLFALIIGLTEAYNRSKRFRDIVNDLFAAIRDKLVPIVSRLYAKLKEPVGDVLKAVLHGVEIAIPAIENLVKAFQHLPFEIRAVIAATAGLLLLIAGFTGVFAGPILAIVGLGYAFIEAYKHSQTFRVVVRHVLDDLKTAFDGARTIFERWREGFKTLPHWGKVAVVAIGSITAALILLDAASLLNGPGLLITALGALTIAFIEAYKHIGPFRAVVNATVDAFKLLAKILSPLTNLIGGTKTVLAGLFLVFAAPKIISIIAGFTRISTVLKLLGFNAEVATAKVAILRGALLRLALNPYVITFALVAIGAEIVANKIKSLQEQVIKAQSHLAPKTLEVKLLPRLAAEIKADRAKGLGLGEIITKLRQELGGNTDEANQLITNAFALLDGHLTIEGKKFRKNLKDAFSTGPAQTDVSTGGHVNEAQVVTKNALDFSKALADAEGVIRKQIETQNSKTKQAVDALKSQLTNLHASLVQALQNETTDVANAVQQAKQNLSSIASTIAGDIGQILDKPFADAQANLTASQNKLNLEALRRQVILPGGGALSKDPKKALAELEALQNRAGGVSRAAVANFIQQYKSALLATEQDKVNKIKTTAQQRLDDLAYALKTGKISSKQFTEGLVAELKRDHVSYRLAGKELGTAFAGGFRDQVNAAIKQAKALTAAGRAGIDITAGGGTKIDIIKPLDVLHKDQRAVEKIQREIGQKQHQISQKIADNTAKTNALLQKIVDLQKQAKAASNNTPLELPGSKGKGTTAANNTTG